MIAIEHDTNVNCILMSFWIFYHSHMIELDYGEKPAAPYESERQSPKWNFDHKIFPN